MIVIVAYFVFLGYGDLSAVKYDGWDKMNYPRPKMQLMVRVKMD